MQGDIPCEVVSSSMAASPCIIKDKPHSKQKFAAAFLLDQPTDPSPPQDHLPLDPQIIVKALPKSYPRCMSFHGPSESKEEG